MNIIIYTISGNVEVYTWGTKNNVFSGGNSPEPKSYSHRNILKYKIK